MRWFQVTSLLLATVVAPMGALAQEGTEGTRAATIFKGQIVGVESVFEGQQGQLYLYWTTSAAQMDGAILVVSAADGPMPQTQENVRTLLLDPDLKALRSGELRRMTLAVPNGTALAEALRKAFESRHPLGDLTLRVPTGEGENYMTWNLTEAYVSSYSMSAGRGAIVAADFNYVERVK